MGEFRWTNKGPLTEAVELGVEKVMLEIWVDARETAPVDTGNLANSVIPDGPHVQGNTVVGYVGTNVHYAPFVEFGTRYQAAQPFLGPALEKARRRYGR